MLTVEQRRRRGEQAPERVEIHPRAQVSRAGLLQQPHKLVLPDGLRRSGPTRSNSSAQCNW